MTTANLVNRIVEKFGGDRVKFVRIGIAPGTSIQHVVFDYAFNRYIAAVWDSRIVVRQMEHNSELYQLDNQYSRWIEGVLNGMARNEEGELK